MSINDQLTQQDLNSLLFQAKYALHKSLTNAQSLPSCINCDHFEPTNEYCKKWDKHPPAKVIVFSCGVGGWEGLIPF